MPIRFGGSVSGPWDRSSQIGLAGSVPTGATPLTGTIMVLFFSSTGSAVPMTRISAFLICFPFSSPAHDPAVVIYMGKDKHESEFRSRAGHNSSLSDSI